ncbi:hypothetical protein HK405_010670 [Cladochytrium tenue]|nr:hypothetical protein HK405_010670 [Cladochytrium tenue]
MAALTYQLEEYERQLIIFSNKVDLKVAKFVKRSVIRDFRIDKEVIEDAMAEDDSYGDDDEDDDGSVAEADRTILDSAVSAEIVEESEIGESEGES